MLASVMDHLLTCAMYRLSGGLSSFFQSQCQLLDCGPVECSEQKSRRDGSPVSDPLIGVTHGAHLQTRRLLLMECLANVIAHQQGNQVMVLQ